MPNNKSHRRRYQEARKIIPIMDPPKLTLTQSKFYAYLRNHILEYGIPPTQAEIATHFKISQPAARNRLYKLAEKGKITYHSRLPRSATLINWHLDLKDYLMRLIYDHPTPPDQLRVCLFEQPQTVFQIKMAITLFLSTQTDREIIITEEKSKYLPGSFNPPYHTSGIKFEETVALIVSLAPADSLVARKKTVKPA